MHPYFVDSYLCVGSIYFGKKWVTLSKKLFNYNISKYYLSIVISRCLLNKNHEMKMQPESFIGKPGFLYLRISLKVYILSCYMSCFTVPRVFATLGDVIQNNKRTTDFSYIDHSVKIGDPGAFNHHTKSLLLSSYPLTYINTPDMYVLHNKSNTNFAPSW